MIEVSGTIASRHPRFSSVLNYSGIPRVGDGIMRGMSDGDHQGHGTEDGAQGSAHAFRKENLWVLLALLCVPLSGLLPLDAARHAGHGLEVGQLRLGIGIFLCIAILWLTEALPLAATALLVPVLGVLSGVTDMKGSMACFGDPLIFLFFGGFALSAAMAAQGLDRWVARLIIVSGKGGFLRVSCLVFCVTAFLSMWMSNTATTALMIPLVLGILRHLPAGEATPGCRAFLLLGTAYAASIGGLGTLVGTPPNGIAAARLGIGFVEWLRFGLPSMAVLLPLMVLVLFVVLRPGKPRIETPPDLGFSWNRGRRITLGIFIATAVAWTGGGWIAPRIGVTNSFDTLAVLVALFLLVVTRVVSWREIERGTEWGVLLLFGGGIALSQILEKTGAGLFMAREIVLLTDGWPVLLLLGVSLAAVILLGEFASNTATAALMVPVYFAVAVELGLPPAKLVIPMALVSSCGFMLPVATPPNAMVFATGLVRQRDMLRVGALLDAVSLAALTGLAWWLF